MGKVCTVVGGRTCVVVVVVCVEGPFMGWYTKWYHSVKTGGGKYTEQVGGTGRQMGSPKCEEVLSQNVCKRGHKMQMDKR